jgi:hypothetical protein
VGAGVQLGPLGKSATEWPLFPAPGWLWWWRIWWNEGWQGKPKYSEKIFPSSTLSTTNPTSPNPVSNPGRRSGKPATNRLSYGAAMASLSSHPNFEIPALSRATKIHFVYIHQRRSPHYTYVPLKKSMAEVFSFVFENNVCPSTEYPKSRDLMRV